MYKVNYAIHHQVIADCPKCNEMVIEDLGEGEDDMAEGLEIKCPQCGCEFELDEPF